MGSGQHTRAAAANLDEPWTGARPIPLNPATMPGFTPLV